MKGFAILIEGKRIIALHIIIKQTKKEERERERELLFFLLFLSVLRITFYVRLWLEFPKFSNIEWTVIRALWQIKQVNWRSRLINGYLFDVQRPINQDFFLRRIITLNNSHVHCTWQTSLNLWWGSKIRTKLKEPRRKAARVFLSVGEAICKALFWPIPVLRS